VPIIDGFVAPQPTKRKIRAIFLARLAEHRLKGDYQSVWNYIRHHRQGEKTAPKPDFNAIS
jgi:hypothetical protein